MDYHKIINKLLSYGFIGYGYCLWLSIRFRGGIAKKMRYLKYANMARKNKVVWFRIARVAADFTNAWYDMSYMPKEERKWYITHGFSPNRKKYCGVTPENYKKYLSDFEFYNSANYKNYNDKSSSAWFNNKLNTYYLLQPFVKYMPKHYYYASKGVMYPLDVEEKHNSSAETIVKLIKGRAIAAKKCLGGHGDGFYKLEYKNGAFFANDEGVSEKDLKQLIEKMDGYIITDFVKPAFYLREIGGEDAFAVLRTMVIYDENDGPQFERVMLRIGTTKSGHTQALHDYLYLGIDDNGAFYNPLIELSDYDFERIETHPDTGKKLLGNSLKNMDKLKNIVTRISGYLPTTPYLILDIIPTDDSFSILEINSHGQPFNFEPYNPVKNSKYFRKLFKLDCENMTE